ncbi:hypothetical protein AGIG_G5351 [Arapaima gigas]
MWDLLRMSVGVRAEHLKSPAVVPSVQMCHRKQMTLPKCFDNQDLPLSGREAPQSTVSRSGRPTEMNVPSNKWKMVFAGIFFVGFKAWWSSGRNVMQRCAQNAEGTVCEAVGSCVDPSSFVLNCNTNSGHFYSA